MIFKIHTLLKLEFKRLIKNNELLDLKLSDNLWHIRKISKNRKHKNPEDGVGPINFFSGDNKFFKGQQ